MLLCFAKPQRHALISNNIIFDIYYFRLTIFFNSPSECTTASLEVSIVVDICAMYLLPSKSITYYNILYNIRETERNQSHCGSYKQREVCNIIIIYYRIYAARARKFYVVQRWKSQYKTRVQSVNQDCCKCERVDGRNGEKKYKKPIKKPRYIRGTDDVRILPSDYFFINPVNFLENGRVWWNYYVYYLKLLLKPIGHLLKK